MPTPRVPASPEPWEAVIVGGGPAGLAAGLQLSRAGYRTLLVEREQLGGKALGLERIENYPGFGSAVSGWDLMGRWIHQARSWGLAIRRGLVRRISRRDGLFRLGLAGGETLVSRAVLYCAGARFRRLGVQGERRLAGRGVHDAAFDLAPRFAGERVAVVGGGEAALHQALQLSRHASTVLVLTRSERLRAHRGLVRRLAKRRNIRHLGGLLVEGVRGEERLESVQLRDPATGLKRELPVRGLFVLIGQDPPRPSGPVGAPGFFVAGDASGGPFRQVAVAAGEGIRAAMACIHHLEEG